MKRGNSASSAQPAKAPDGPKRAPGVRRAGAERPAGRPRATAVHNEDIAAMFDEMADLLELEDDNPFRIRAYRNGARVVRDLGREVSAMVKAGEDLTALSGIGKDLAGKIREITVTGELAALVDLRAGTPPALLALLKLPGLGPKRVKALYTELGVTSVEDLTRAVREGKVRAIAGFGEKTEQRLLRALDERAGEWGRFKLSAATEIAAALEAYLRLIPGVIEATVAGSFRRCRETVGDLDIVVTASMPGSVLMDHIVAYEGVEKVVAEGPTRATFLLRSGLQVDVRVVPEESYGAALHYFTGSKAHNIAIRKLGQDRGLRINEYGVYRGEDRVAGDTEASVYASVGLPFIAPELREDRGEIAAAAAGHLPRLVELRDIRGDLHAHTALSDGRGTLPEMAEAAQLRGLEYLAITEHSRRLTIARGLDAERLAQQIEAIDRLNEDLSGITLLKSIEVDILEDGQLDLPDEILGRLDLVVGAVHSHFNLSREAQTKRILRAMERPYFTILAHPMTRLFQRRDPIDVDMGKILRAARERGCFLEIDAQPERMDLSDVYARMAGEEGVLVAIDSDAHSAEELDNMRFGVGQARRAWLSAKDVVNTRRLAELRVLLRRARG